MYSLLRAKQANEHFHILFMKYYANWIWTSLHSYSCKMTHNPWGRWQVCVSLLAQATHCFHLLNQLHTPPVQECVFKRKTLLFQECYYSSRGQSASGFSVVGKNLKMSFPSNRLLPALCFPRGYSVCGIILKRQYVHIILRITTHLAAPEWLTQEFRNSQSLLEAVHNE